MIEKGSTSEIIVTRYKDLSAKDLTEDKIVLSDSKKEKLGQLDRYLKLYSSPISLLKISRGGEEEFIGVCSRVTGTQLNEIFYLGAPSDSFGLDTNDLNNDWLDLYKPSSDYYKRVRLIDHVGIPGWEHFSRNQKRIRGFIFDDVLGYKGPHYVSDKLSPVIRIRKTKSGFEWNFNDFDDQIMLEIQDTLDLTEYETRNLHTSLGAIYAAVFSPDTRTSCWKSSDTHSRQKTNTIGATQSWAYSLWKGDLLFGDQFLQKMLEAMGEQIEERQLFQLQINKRVASWDKHYQGDLTQATSEALGWIIERAYESGYGFQLKTKLHISLDETISGISGIRLSKYATDGKKAFLFNISPASESKSDESKLKLSMTNFGRLCLETGIEKIGYFAPEDVFSITLIPPQSNS